MTAEPNKVKPLETAAEAEDLATPIPDDQRTITEQLDAEEAEFRAIRRDLEGVKGTSAAGIVTIGVRNCRRRMSSSARTVNSDRSCRS